MAGLVKCVFILCAALAASGNKLGDNDVIFHLFSKQNPQMSQPLLPIPSSIMASNFLPNRQTVITIHSSGDSVTGNFNAFLVPAHLSAQDVNLLAVDWSPASGMYTQGLSNAVACAERIASFINLLSSAFNYGPSNIRIVGVGLGGHIAGIAADRVIGNIPHIIAIDPSLPGWTHHPDILKRGQALLVEVLHATAGTLGYDYPLGDLDFYPNGGQNQIGCGSDISCSHILSYIFYAESISTAGGSRFVGTACENYDQAIAQNCSGQRGVVFGGLANKAGQSGIYSFQTNPTQPFAQG
ncbi:hypothetical protein PYW07_007040 [Mythimna separata]|uniref:Lipase domain-containing protein n=1 Tax=Mythimna separata TaxID=271217 RepID=A0AAD7Z247_MYTSE|nr:hypothetical protein PYW07_007040 [Mythimna separata]